MNQRQFEYDVAFSFLQRDELLALALNDRLQDRVKTFVYPEHQKVVAGTDGEETFNRVFSKDARIVVVLFRMGWGDSPWTRIEKTAIRNRGHEHGYNFTVFVPLDEPPDVPEWLPTAQVWVDLGRYGIDGAAAVIEARIRDAGGKVHQETVEEHAQRVARDIEFGKRRDKFQWEEGVNTARDELKALSLALEQRVGAVKKSSGLTISIAQHGPGYYIAGLGLAIFYAWSQKYENTLREAHLQVWLTNGVPVQFPFEGPKSIQSMRFKFDLLRSETRGWVLEETQKREFSTDALAEYLINFYLKNGRSP